MSKPGKKARGRPKKRSMKGTAVFKNPGRPKKMDMNEVSYSTLNRRAHDMAENYDVCTLQLALDIAKKKANYPEPIEATTSAPVAHSLESGFALFLENDFSKLQWDRLVQDSKEHDAAIYPSFYNLAKVKAQCRPSLYTVETEICVQVSFQLMLNKSAERLVHAVGSDWLEEDLKNLVLVCAYGFDSSSGFINPNQRFKNAENVTQKTELSLFASTFIISGLMTTTNKTLWMNPTPQSVRFCRPLRLAIEKETEETVMCEKNRLDCETKELYPHSFSLPNGKSASVDFDPRFSMIDGKCLNFITENAVTTRCPVCYISMEHFNQKADWNSIVPSSNLNYGLATLHCGIKTLELLIKLSCRLTLKTWTVRKEFKGKKDEEMARIRKALFDKFSVRVDEVKHGSGTSLNGNTARTCLKDPSELAKVLGINEDLVTRLSFVLIAFKRKEGVNLDKLQKYCTETYKLFFEKYPWAKMNPSVHKMLRHGVDIARNFPLSLAYFAEDAAESMHKCYRKSSVYHARQNSRENRLKDVYNRAVEMSDPFISMIYLEKRMKIKKQPLPPEFISLFELTGDKDVSDEV